MTRDNTGVELPAPGVIISGGTYRATTTGGENTWLCPHVHFTQQSARTCADQRVRKAAKAALALSQPAA